MELKIKVPTNLSEITLAQYKKYLKVIEANSEIDNAETFISLKMLEIFCHVPYDQAVALRVKDVTHIVQILADMLNSKPDLVSTFKLGDTEFGFIPKLDDMSFGEYIDLDTFLGDWSKMEKAMAVLYRPVKSKIGKRYLIEDYDPGKWEAAMNYIPMDAVISSILFFYRLGIELSTAMTKYLQESEEMAILEMNNSQVNGVGISRFTHSLKEMLDDLMISQD
mgnify:CR=1 FL=1|tara:strand:+ start:6317 stop:6982 length:666 start_codon:yes stop_codon:yes gene_type:complete